MANFTQAKREMGIVTPLGADVLLLGAMRGAEQLGRLFEYTVELASPKLDIDFGAILGKPVAVRVDAARDRKRWFHGYVTEFAFTGSAGGLHTYRAVLRPWLWFLTQSMSCRVFQNLTAVEIIKKVLGHADYSSVMALRDGLTGSYRKRVYCVQYRESDFDFVSRLMEEEGIYYFFEHEENRHTLVLADSYSAHKMIAGYDKLPFRVDSGAATRVADSVADWQQARAIRSGKYQLRDYDFEKSRTQLAESAQDLRKHDHAKFERYDWPGGFTVGADGQALVRTRLDALQVEGQRVHGAGGARRLAAGGLFKLAEHPRADQNREYLLVGTEIDLDAGGFDATGGGSASYACRFTAISSSQAYRSPQATPKPVVHGPQTATVVGKSGAGPVWTDKYGRVKVQFHWDREGKKDQDSCCWLRVAQAAAGPQSGAVALPRIGWEVVVGFLEGDPDQPIIVGSVHNDANMPPYGLPDAKTKTVFRSHTHEGEGYNELRLDDAKDKEEIYVLAQRDFKRVVKNNDVLEVGLQTKDKGDRTVKIANDETVEVGHDQTTTVTNAHKLKAQTVLIEGQTSIELKVGASSIKIEAGKITISSPQIALDAKGTGEFKAGGPLTLQGALVKIN